MTPTDPTPTKRRGRPPTGQALTSTQRNAARRAKLGDPPLQAVLTPEAAAALQRWVDAGYTKTAAVNAALAASVPPALPR